MGAFVYPVRFPISDGVIVARLRAGLAAKWSASGLTVQQRKPDAMTRRVVTVRNDSGPQERRVSFRRYGVNVWADSSVDAENIALDVLEIVSTIADGAVIVSTDSLSGPFEVPDDPLLTVGNKNLTHYYLTFRALVKGNTP